MQTIPGVEFEPMLSELGKHGASFLLATQSLAKLDALSPTMRDTLLANVGCLAVFQVSARELAWELGRERISEDDIVGQSVHHWYVRASVATERLTAFSMTVRKPELGDPELAAGIRKEAAEYLTSVEDIAAQQAEHHQKIDQFAAETEESRERVETPAVSPPKTKGRRPPSKHQNRPD